MYIKMIDGHSFDDDYRPYPDMDDYYNTDDVKPASLIEKNLKNGDTVDTASAEYNKDHTDFGNNTVEHTKRLPNGEKEKIINRISAGLFKRLRI